MAAFSRKSTDSAPSSTEPWNPKTESAIPLSLWVPRLPYRLLLFTDVSIFERNENQKPESWWHCCCVVVVVVANYSLTNEWYPSMQLIDWLIDWFVYFLLTCIYLSFVLFSSPLSSLPSSMMLPSCTLLFFSPDELRLGWLVGGLVGRSLPQFTYLLHFFFFLLLLLLLPTYQTIPVNPAGLFPPIIVHSISILLLTELNEWMNEPRTLDPGP